MQQSLKRKLTNNYFINVLCLFHFVGDLIFKQTLTKQGPGLRKTNSSTTIHTDEMNSKQNLNDSLSKNVHKRNMFKQRTKKL